MTRLTFINNHGIQSWCESYSSRTGPSPDEHVKFKDAKNLEPIVPAQCTQNQAYPHKILTGRRSRMQTIRQTVGLAGFRKRDESAHDAFGSGHSSTSISAGLGMAVARDMKGENNHVVAVIGDGAMTAGQAYKARNNAGYLDTNLVIILNDNKEVSPNCHC